MDQGVACLVEAQGTACLGAHDTGQVPGCLKSGQDAAAFALVLTQHRIQAAWSKDMLLDCLALKIQDRAHAACSQDKSQPVWSRHQAQHALALMIKDRHFPCLLLSYYRTQPA